MKFITLTCQVLFLTLVFLIGQSISQWLHLPVPGSIIGLLLLFLLLHFKIIKLKWIEQGGNLLIGELLLFFIPAIVGLMNYGDVLKSFGIQIIIIITVSTIIVMSLTGIIAEYISKRKETSIE
ncbi:CidA/LrgA family holin-like protein [Priestia megaterium]|nr:CidA/LrgA family holin-like protein [Priestia megaterium]